MKLSILGKVNVCFGIVVLLLIALGWISYWGAAIFIVVALAFTVIDRDLTGKRKTERALKESREEMHLLLNSTVEAIYGMDREGRFNFCNPACLRLLGYHSEKDLLARDIHEMIHHARANGALYPKEECKILEAITSGKAVHVENEVFWRADGCSFPAEYWAYPVYKGERLKGAVVTFLDITERKRNEQRVHVQHATTRILAEAVDFAEANEEILRVVCENLDWDFGLSWKVNGDSQRLEWDRCWSKSGVSLANFEAASRSGPLGPGVDLPGRVWKQGAPVWIPDIQRETTLGRLREATEMGLHAAFAVPIILAGDVLGVMEFFSRSIRQPDLELMELFAAMGSQIGQFIERLRAREALEQARDAAIEASRAKSEFLATMSHEIRTPMNSIVGMADLLGETPLNSEQKEYIQLLKRGGDTLLKLIDDILDLAKVESGRVDLEETEFGLREFLERTLESLAIRAHQKGLEISCYVGPEIPNGVIGDANRLRQILLNLLGNAIKFTPKGEVFVEVRRAEGEETNSRQSCSLVFLVRDTGIGIPEDKWESVFNPFTQADSSTTRRYGGTGWGLSMSNKLVEVMGGRIWIESKLLQGTTFYFTVPLKLRPHPDEPAWTFPPEIKRLKVLIVDDHGTSRFVLKEVLSSWGLQVYEAEGGKQALDEIRRAACTGVPYSLVLLDCRMPGMGGFQAAEALKREPVPMPSMVMMLTADARSGDIASARDLSLSGYVIKPVKRADLAEALKKALVRMEALPGTTAASSSQKKNPGETRKNGVSLRLLLVEDSEDNRILIQSYLRKSPYYVDVAENGYMAVQKFTGGGQYDLILMDMHMPLMDGYTATREIRKWEREHKNGQPAVPIIALTANALKEDVDRSFEAGCNAHLTKPIKKADLLKEISVFENHKNPSQ